MKRFRMKKLSVILLAAAMGLSLALCSCDEKENGGENLPNVGGWTTPESCAVTSDSKAALEKATEQMTGGTYKPVALLGSQVVAGTNYRLLCEFTPATKDAVASYAIVTVYEDLEGNAEITEILNSEAQVKVTDEVIDGGWAAPETPDLTDDSTQALADASEGVVGASYEPVVLLGTQVVAGTNYCMLCEITPVAENAESHYAVVVVYMGADGTTDILETFDFTPTAG